MKLPAVHFAIIAERVKIGLDKMVAADFGAIMSAAAALKRFAEENRGVGIELATKDSILQVGNSPKFIHRGDFFGKILSANGNNILIENLGKRNTMKLVAEENQENCKVVAIPGNAQISMAVPASAPAPAPVA